MSPGRFISDSLDFEYHISSSNTKLKFKKKERKEIKRKSKSLMDTFFCATFFQQIQIYYMQMRGPNNIQDKHDVPAVKSVIQFSVYHFFSSTTN